jgi:acyl-coenzyme A thioesterase PaaI-like protein
MRLEDDQMCFVCGPKNPVGLHLEFWDDGERYHTRFTPEPHHTGYAGVTHGGIMTAVLDEVMGRLLWMRDLRAATAQMEVRWSRAAHIGETLHFVGWIEEARGRLVKCAAEARNEAGQLVARASAKFMRLASPVMGAGEPISPAAIECVEDNGGAG